MKREEVLEKKRLMLLHVHINSCPCASSSSPTVYKGRKCLARLYLCQPDALQKGELEKKRRNMIIKKKRRGEEEEEEEKRSCLGKCFKEAIQVLSPGPRGPEILPSPNST